MDKVKKARTGNFIGILLLLIGFTFIISKEVSLADETTSAGFTFNIVYPENQITDKGYLDLLMTPGQKQKVSLTLNNPSDEVVNVDLTILGAKTNKNGVIAYSEPNIANDDSLKYPFETLVTGPETVQLKANESKNVEFEIAMPESEIEGQIVGGISMIRSSKDDKEEEADGTQIKNRYRYTAPIVLQTSETPVNPKAEFKKVYPEQQNGSNTIFVDFSNTQGAFLNEMSVNVSITEKGKETVLYQTKKVGMRMAPNTMISFPVSMQGERMVPGNYTAVIEVKGESGVAETWTEDFEITKEQSDKYNERDIGLYEEKTMDWKLIAMIVVGALTLIVVIYLIISQVRKKQDKSSNKRKKKNKKLRCLICR